MDLVANACSEERRMWRMIVLACLVSNVDCLSLSEEAHTRSSFVEGVPAFGGYLYSFLDMLYPLPTPSHSHGEVSSDQKKLLEELSDPATTYAVWQAAMEVAQDLSDDASRIDSRELLPDAIMFLVSNIKDTLAPEERSSDKPAYGDKQMADLLATDTPAGDWQALADHGAMMWRRKNNQVAGRAAALLDDIAGL
ncbi:hypothetical protein BESB_017710 [Besnoitia besnoiti]|uniref:Uncharacterized protein n=1 Tax=Besnoitia besnoiti TaxID=94643 RepID=A0A2A9M9V1_BESBE|nr:hypothetical protein BESB_017710 [Besnoitia besnoiti]PFH32453.1 hypothetical protein BESB_017710 [Besnoitia besnoiti]